MSTRLTGSDFKASRPQNVTSAVIDWYERNQRDLPWRKPNAGAWAVLVSEVMLQQTPVKRVLPRYLEWMRRWPTPAALAQAPVADVLRVWDRLGYPRRALRLQQAAGQISERFGGVVPETEEELRTLAGVGSYTAAAVASFSYHRRAAVLDTNIRRVFARFFDGAALPPPTQRKAESERAWALLPDDGAACARWNVAVMELGALVCKARDARCHECPLAGDCAWLAAGKPADTHAAKRRSQPWHGTDRQARGAVMAALRDHGWVDSRAVIDLWPDNAQRERVLISLEEDGLAETDRDADGVVLAYRLPGTGVR